jgi:hypothetical protein
MNITAVTGLTEAQKDTLKVLGADRNLSYKTLSKTTPEN